MAGLAMSVCRIELRVLVLRIVPHALLVRHPLNLSKRVAQIGVNGFNGPLTPFRKAQ